MTDEDRLMMRARDQALIRMLETHIALDDPVSLLACVKGSVQAIRDYWEARRVPLEETP